MIETTWDYVELNYNDIADPKRLRSLIDTLGIAWIVADIGDELQLLDPSDG